MKTKFKVIRAFILLELFFLIPVLINGQEIQKHHRLFVLSNLESLQPNAPEFDAIQTLLDSENNSFTLLINGDFLDNNGLEITPTNAEKEKIDRLIKLVNNKGNIIFIPGDLEWDDGNINGLKKVKALEQYLEAKLGKGNAIFPQKGCIGPEVVDVGEQLRIVTINSQWFLQQQLRPEEEDTKCKALNEREFWDEFDDAIADADNRNIVVATHHPALSRGRYAGYKLTGKHFFPPLIGSVIAAYHQNIGGRKDLSRAAIKQFGTEVLKRAERHPGLIFVSGHEYDLQVLYKDGNYHINSGAAAKAVPVGRGSETIFRQKEPGFAQITFHKNGKVDVNILSIKDRSTIETSFDRTLYSSPCDEVIDDIPVNSLYNPCPPDTYGPPQDPNHPVSGTRVAGSQYAAGPLQRMIFGKHYRSIWTAPVHNIPYLNLDTIYGGLTPYAKGGAAQTLSLKFKSGDGQRFAFRSVDKNPARKKDKALAAGLYGRIIKGLTSTQHPYASTIVTSMMDVLELPHSSPKLYLMPDSPKLGPFRKEFAGKFGWLELKPKGKNKKKAVFKDADKVVSTFQMYQKLLDDNDNRLDVSEFVKARIFDIWISDWDRHGNNWKWLAYKQKKGKLYKPFPKDRDKAFVVFNGLFRVLDWEFITPDLAHFGKKYGGMKSLNYKNRSMDRWLANSFDRADWKREAENIQTLMTDEVIRKAIQTVPPEVQELTNERLTKVLQKRRERLVKEIDKYYLSLAKYIDIVGSNSRELFELKRLENGDIHVTVFKLKKKSGKKGKKLYERLIKKSETKEIRLHGLAKKDHFKITGEASKSILIRIIGGDDEDVIIDDSKVKGIRKLTKVYDRRKADSLTLNTEAKIVKTPEIIQFESDNIFNYDRFLILPSFSYNEDDGYILGVSGKLVKQGFNKPGFKSKYNFRASITTRENYAVSVNGQFKHVIGKWDMFAGISTASNDRSFQRFYGYGNGSVFDQMNDDTGFYINKTTSFETHVGIIKTFWEKSSFQTSLLYDFKNVQPNSIGPTGESIYNVLPRNNGLGETVLIGSKMELNFDFRDNAVFPRNGMHYIIRNYSFLNTDLNWGLGGRLESELTAFLTRGIKIPVTLSVRTGISHSYGDTPFYYKSYIGQQSNHRGFVRNRFGGDTAAFLNSELRFHFGTWVTPIVPFKYGIFGLYDIGRVWSDEGIGSPRYHFAYGGGIYIVPYTESLNLTLTLAKADKEQLLLSFRVGFFVR